MNRTSSRNTYLVAAIAKFTDETECMEFLNQARVGLAGYFFSRDVQQIWRVAEAMEVGMVGCNTGMLSCVEAPFGGYKDRVIFCSLCFNLDRKSVLFWYQIIAYVLLTSVNRSLVWDERDHSLEPKSISKPSTSAWPMSKNKLFN